MATSIRLPEVLRADADAYARRAGVSLNALLCLALREYLDAHGARPDVDAVPLARPELSGSDTSVSLVDAHLQGVNRAERRRLQKQKKRR